ncbi:MAG: glycosyltransferase family 4 protein [Planctomycetes bacterium]|nr:glycosyltransferase family 4 protein [Planctomycetota bacterium]
MKLGVEAKWFFRGPPGGHTYARQFTEALCRERSGEDLRVFLRADDRDVPHAWPRGVDVKHALWGTSYLMNRFFLRGGMTDDLDWVLSHNFTPRSSRARRALIIHDLIFLSHPDEFTWKERLYFKGIRASARSADLIVTVSEYVRDDVRRRGYARDDQPVVVCPCAAAPQFTRASETKIAAALERHDLPDRYVLYLGRLNSRKNIRRTIEAFASADIPPEVPLVLVGERNWKMFDLDGFARELGVADRIRKLGFVPFEDLPALLSGARFLVFCPLAEGFGIPPVEAMACGTPVLASNATSVPEVVGSSGILVDPYDTAEIRRGFERLVHDDALHARLAANCPADVARFGWDRSARTFLDALRQAS